MVNSNPPSFEQKLQAAVQMPQPRPEFLAGLRARLAAETLRQMPQHQPWYLSLGNRLGLIFRHKAWAAGMITLLLVAVLLIAGPQRVLAAVRGLLGYIPGVGIIDSSAPIRVLAEPIIVVKGEIAITVTSAVATRDRTHIDYRIFGVPASAYPTREDVQGCLQTDYLRLPDGTRLEHFGDDFQPVPDRINEAVLVIPCIFNTLPDTVPNNWELPLRFVPAPPNLTVMPVREVSPSPLAQPTKTKAAVVTTDGSTPIPPAESPITVQKVVETADGYILAGIIHLPSNPGQLVRMDGSIEIRDANGKVVRYTNPRDIAPDVNWGDPNERGWTVQFQAAGLAYPLTLSIPGVTLKQSESKATATFEFDAGSNPQMGQEFTPNQEVQLLGHTLKVVSIRVDSRNGYNFTFQVDPQVERFDIQIEGYPPAGWGEGGKWDGQINRSLSFVTIPTGMLKVTVSGLTLTGDPITWQGQWSPETPRADFAASPTPQPGLCLTQDNIDQLPPLPVALAKGKALFYEKIAETGNWGLVLYNLDGSGRQVVVPEGNWGALSPDGKQVAYSSLDNTIHIIQEDAAGSILSDQVLPKASGVNIHWSPDGKQLGYIHLSEGIIDSPAIASVNGAEVRQVSNLNYATIIGWSPDGAKLYFAVPYTGGAAWKVYAYETADGSAASVLNELFIIENGTPKFLNPQLSPDGQWIAYRGQDSSSVYLVHPDGSGMHLFAENTRAGGIAWSSSGWLGMSSQAPDSSQSSMILVKPGGCEAYRLPDSLHGELQGLYLP